MVRRVVVAIELVVPFGTDIVVLVSTAVVVGCVVCVDEEDVESGCVVVVDWIIVVWETIVVGVGMDTVGPLVLFESCATIRQPKNKYSRLL